MIAAAPRASSSSIGSPTPSGHDARTCGTSAHAARSADPPRLVHQRQRRRRGRPRAGGHVPPPPRNPQCRATGADRPPRSGVISDEVLQTLEQARATGAPWCPGSPARRPVPFDHAYGLWQDRRTMAGALSAPCHSGGRKSAVTEKGPIRSIAGKKPAVTEKGPYVAYDLEFLGGETVKTKVITPSPRPTSRSSRSSGYRRRQGGRDGQLGQRPGQGPGLHRERIPCLSPQGRALYR